MLMKCVEFIALAVIVTAIGYYSMIAFAEALPLPV